MVSFHPPDVRPVASLDLPNLPDDTCGCSSLRIFIALGCSTAFSLLYGSLAAHNRWAEGVLIPLLDLLQSVSMLGFLSITVTGFLALFPGNLLGLEAASIFAIFTSQVWNMTFSFYQFPFATLLFIRAQGPIGWGSILLIHLPPLLIPYHPHYRAGADQR